ncbi:MAG TPA: LuxR C-terminal-related transcriptional regulator [Solimonas sp.]|nr:LuxR C-terminal-related transcriptional regulator [Solimonas sp.]
MVKQVPDIGIQGEGGHGPLIQSKLTPPVLSRYIVSRSQIFDRVLSAIDAKLVLVRAPAGFGKTTVMLQLRERFVKEGTSCGWLNVDEADNDAPRFRSYLCRALLDVLGPDAAAENVLQQQGEIAEGLMDRISHHGAPFVLFIDECELLRSPACLALLAQLVERLPQGALLVLGSRGLPEIGVARWRARGQLVEIDPAQLRFSEEEAGEFLMQRRGLSLRPEQVQGLCRRTEGWVAALWLASVALERRPDADDFIKGFSGSNAAIADYLAEDVLRRLEPQTREFLLKTSILEQLIPELCDALCEREDSARQLEIVDHANLFVIPLDDERTAYRYHSVFADFLRAQLKRQMPEKVSALHRIASDWFLMMKRPIPAIGHALQSGDLSYALPLLQKHADSLLDQGRLRLLTRWIDPLSAEDLKPFPRLRMIHAWAVNFTRGAHNALNLIEGVEAEQLDDPEAAALLLVLRPMALGMSDRIDDAFALSKKNLPLVPPSSTYAYGMLAQTMANTWMILGRFAEARAQADQARRTPSGSDTSFHFALAESVEGAIDLMQGRLKQALVRLRAAAGVNGAQDIGSISRNSFPGVLLAEALYEAGEVEQAERLLGMFVPLLQDLGLPDQLIIAHSLYARILWDGGKIDQALSALEDLESIGHRLGYRRVIAGARLERARGLIMRGDHAAAKDQLQRSGDAAFWKEISQRNFTANDISVLQIAHARWLLRSGAAAEAIPLLKQQLETAEHGQRNRRALKVRILLAEALHRDSQHKPAMRMLGRALDFAGSEGFISTFREEGPALQALLKEALISREGESGVQDDDAIKLLLQRVTRDRKADAGIAPEGITDLAEPLTRKEIKVLDLLAQGYSNNTIAEKLFVSETTVRTHLRNLNVKLHASSRTQAVVIARRLGLVS